MVDADKHHTSALCHVAATLLTRVAASWKAQTPNGCRGNSRNGTRSKTVLTEIGPVQIEVPRDRDGSFEPHLVRKRQRRLDGIDAIVLSLTARGLTTGEVAAHFAEVYWAKVSTDTISRITEKVVEEMTAWQNRPLDRGRFPLVVANPGVWGFGCPGMRRTRYRWRSNAATSS